MTEKSGSRWTPQNPLGVIALFVFLIETMATVSLRIVAGQPFALVLVWFIVLFPTGIASCFFLLLWLKREALFGPMDFADQSDFSKLLRKVEHIEVRQDVASINRATAMGDVYQTIDKLLELEDPMSAMQLGRTFLERKEFARSFDVFDYLSRKLRPSSPLFNRIVSNRAYSLLGLDRNDEAIEDLLKVLKAIGSENFRTWHSLALAAAYLRKGDTAESDRWIDFTRELRPSGEELEFFTELYPDLIRPLSSMRGQVRSS